MSLVSNRVCIYNLFIGLVLVFHLTYCFKQLCALANAQKYNGCIVQTILIIRYVYHLFYRGNIYTFEGEIARIINQTLAINVTWGNTLFQVEKFM